MENEYRIELCRDYGEKELKDLCKLMNLAFPDCPFDSNYYNWQYMENPYGRVVSYNAYISDGTMAAHYAAIPVKMNFNGKKEDGLLSLNTATHPNHRGKRLFTILADKTYEYAKENGYKFVIGVANANSTHGFLKNLGFYMVAPLDVKVGVGNSYATGVPVGKICCYYDVDMLKWRLACPQFSYTLYHNMILGSIDKPFFKTCVATVPNNIGLEDLGIKKSGSLFGLYIGLGIKTGGLYFNLPKFIKRSPFNLIFKDLTGGELPKITKDNIFFQLLDYDVA